VIIWLVIGVVALVVLFTILGLLLRRIDGPPPATMESGQPHRRGPR
jgi:hypothetical protein